MAANDSDLETGRTRRASGGGLALVVASVALSAASYAPLADTVRIRWTVGAYRHYGPEHAPALVVLAAFPALAAILYVGARRLETDLERTDRIDDREAFGLVYEIGVLVTLGTLVVGQLLVVVLNVWYA